jgi:hypothetical protein
LVDRDGARQYLIVAASSAIALIAGVLLAQSAGTMPPRSGGVVARQRAALERNANLGTSHQETRVQRLAATIERDSSPRRIATEKVDALGREVTVSCASCHANLPSNPQVTSASDLDEFHQGLTFKHGKLVCVSCHQPPNYSALHLADRSALDYGSVQQLCAQCHSKQSTEYAHGAHGGMNGYWDLTRGSRRRHGCIDCHDPHAPAFPHMLRTFHSLDRFLSPAEKDHD